MLLALRSVNQRPAIGEQNMNIGTRVVVGADVLEALEVSDAPDLERAVPGDRVEQHDVVHGGDKGEAGDAVGVLDPEAPVAAPRRRLHVAGLAEHPAQVVPGGGQRGDELEGVLGAGAAGDRSSN